MNRVLSTVYMKESMRVVDDFLIDPMVIRNNAIQQGFADQEFQGSTYHTVNTNIPEEVQYAIEAAYGRAIKIHVAAFRQGKKNSPIHNLVHADNSCAQMAAVLYLNKPEDCVGGTAFWTHEQTGWDKMPSDIELRKAGYTLESFGKEWHEKEKWKLTSICGMRFNRVVFYSTEAFHSRWPFEGFGNNESNARLVLCVFFDFI